MMTAMHGHKWHSEQGPRINAQTKTYTNNFLLWCEKTDHLTDEEFALGIKVCEWESHEAHRLGQEKELWPPSYPGFVGKCKISRDRVPAGVLSARDKYRLEQLEKPPQTEQDKQRNKNIADRTLKNLRGMFETNENEKKNETQHQTERKSNSASAGTES